MRDLRQVDDEDVVAARANGALVAGDRVGSYRIERQLAEGGMGRVYIASHTILPRRAAIKVLRGELRCCARALNGLLQEARVLESLSDPRVARVYDAGVLDDGRPWMAMELVDGVCLAEIMAADTEMSIPLAARTIAAIAEALHPAHARGVVHSDVKPENVIVCTDSDEIRVKLVDWGIARRTTRRQEYAFASGTPSYMCPEQIRGEALDERADIYALGVVAYELFTGAMPFIGEDTGSVFQAHLSITPRSLRELRPEVPRALDELVLAMLAKSADARPSLDTVCAVLADAVAAADAAPPRPSATVIEIDYTCEGSETDRAFTDTVNEVPARARWTPTDLADRDTLRLRRVVSASAAPSAAGTIVVPKDN